MSGNDYTPEVDTSYGLIYRLNYLWAKADGEALSGNLKQWELTLDTIFRNLSYREEVTILKIGKKINVKFTDDAFAIQEKLKLNIMFAKLEKFKAIKASNKLKFSTSKLNHYHAVVNYDIWIRKFMHNELKLYMKEIESTPGSSLFGQAKFGKRRR